MLALAAPREAVTSSTYPNHFRKATEGHVSILVEASVVDSANVLAMPGTVKPQKVRLGFGLFFASHTEPNLDNSSSPQVVGWYPGSHCNLLEVLIRYLHRYYENDLALTATKVHCSYHCNIYH